VGAAGVHPVQRQRQHAGHGAAAVDDDRRAVSAQSPRHNGRPGTVAGLLLHIRHGENVTGLDDGTGQRSDHAAVLCRRHGRRVLRGRVPAGNPGQDAGPDRETVQQRRPRSDQGHRLPGKKVQAQRFFRGVHHQFVSGRTSQMTTATLHVRHYLQLQRRVVKKTIPTFDFHQNNFTYTTR